MALDKTYCRELLEKQQELKDILKVKTSDLTDNYRMLYDMRKTIQAPLFAFCLRELLQMSTEGVSVSMRLALFEQISREDIMLQEEIDEYNALSDLIEVYRGTVYEECEPGLSWSLKRYIAESFFKGKLLKATIAKDSILAYIGGDYEYEVIARVPYDAVEVLEEDSCYFDDWYVGVQREACELEDRFG